MPQGSNPLKRIRPRGKVNVVQARALDPQQIHRDHGLHQGQRHPLGAYNRLHLVQGMAVGDRLLRDVKAMVALISSKAAAL
ncbi:hypothetical protein D3C78_837020 [compost metagenome]